MNLGQGRILLDIRLISLLSVFSGLRKKTCAPGASGLDEHQKTQGHTDRKSTRLNSSHANISYAAFCLKKKKATAAVESDSHTTKDVKV